MDFVSSLLTTNALSRISNDCVLMLRGTQTRVRENSYTLVSRRNFYGCPVIGWPTLGTIFFIGGFSITVYFLAHTHLLFVFFSVLFETPKILIIRCFSESAWFFQHRTRGNFKPAIAARRRHFRLDLQHFSTSDAFHLLFFSFHSLA